MVKTLKVILLVETSDAYSRGLLLGISQYSHLYGPWRFYRSPPFYSEPATRRRVFSRLKDWGADGVIIREPKRNDEIFSMGLPTIVSPNILEDNPNFPALVIDCATTGRLAAEYLLNRGFKRFAYCGFDDIVWSRDRGESFRKRIAENGFETHFYKQPRTRAQCSWRNEQAYMADWLMSLPKPIGLMSCNDDRGQNVAEICKIVGLYVPDEIAIIGVDNDEVICGLSDPPLSSIPLNAERAGYEAAELLDRLMSGEKMAGQRIIDCPTHVITRQSTDILAIEDREVVDSVRFIRQHSKEPIQVTDVVETTTLSRRALEQRFRNVLGRSVLSEIRRVRIELVAQMLVDTTLSISQIALALGYTGVDHIARYFKREMGMNLLAYRKKYGRK